MNRPEIERRVGGIVEALEAMVGLPYDGEPVDQLAHALQTAALARGEDASPELVLAALLHDVARSPEVAGVVYDSGPVDHGEQGARWLAPLLGQDIAWLAASHVPAKRYLVAIEPAYNAGLSEISRRTLVAQGGAMDSAERARVEADPRWPDAVRLRRWDDLAKQPGADVPGVEDYMEDLRVAATRQL